MRTAYKVWSGVAAVTFVLVAAVDTHNNPRPATAAPANPTTSYAPSAVAAAPAAPAVAPAPVETPEVVTVTRVIDGDTLLVDGNRRIRVLGIDACEASTSGGQRATGYVQTALDNPYNSPVTLTREPGVDRDRYGRELRYVQLAGSDFGEYMIRYPEVGVYAGDNDASPAYVSTLAAADDGPRDCSTPDPAPTSSGGSDDGGVYVDHDDHRNHRDGALTGGYCRHKWWC